MCRSASTEKTTRRRNRGEETATTTRGTTMGGDDGGGGNGRPKFSLLGDVLSGIIMAGTSVPQLVAYAETVGVEGHRGLSTAGPSLFTWGLLTNSPWMNAGVTSMTALMTKSNLDPNSSFVGEFGEDSYVYLVSAYSLCVGLMSILLAFLKFGSFVSRVPGPVRAGFKWGCSLAVVSSAIPNAFLQNGSSTMKQLISSSETISNSIELIHVHLPMCSGAISILKILHVLCNPREWSMEVFFVFLLCTIFVMRGKYMLPKILPPGTEVIIATAAATLFTVQYGYNGGIVGEIPSVESGLSLFNGLIELPVTVLDHTKLLYETPRILLDQFHGSYAMLFLSAAVFASINFLSIVGISSIFELENGVSWSPNRELFAQGGACIIGGFTGSAPVSGSLSRSLVSRMAGTTSQLACIITSCCWIFALPYMSIMSNTPKSALSAVIIGAVIKGVIVPREMLNLKAKGGWSASLVGWGTAFITASMSPTIGFGFGLFFYLLVDLFYVKNEQEKGKSLATKKKYV